MWKMLFYNCSVRLKKNTEEAWNRHLVFCYTSLKLFGVFDSHSPFVQRNPVITNGWSLSLKHNMLPVYINTWLTAASCGITLTTGNAFQILSVLWNVTIKCVLDFSLCPKILYVSCLDYETVQFKDLHLEAYLAMMYSSITTTCFFNLIFYICFLEMMD